MQRAARRPIHKHYPLKRPRGAPPGGEEEEEEERWEGGARPPVRRQPTKTRANQTGTLHSPANLPLRPPSPPAPSLPPVERWAVRVAGSPL
ncbi:hypothetical protein E2C01_069474 [Portunus trituberculatus]|uniref:Uncharacterized protein n=1 Tax=Portunus trituberculatus TaxID=210409 RepID=A0A5B7HZN0_PORTR|nr:hypothetical protein [Portunus trituberculatus]